MTTSTSPGGAGRGTVRVEMTPPRDLVGRDDELLSINLGALSLVEEAAHDRPLLLVVEDARWLDRSSLDAIAFIARRRAVPTVRRSPATKLPPTLFRITGVDAMSVGDGRRGL